MTSMRMRLVFSFCFLDLVVLFGGAVQWWGGVSPCECDLFFLFVFLILLCCLVVRCSGGEGDDVHANATCFCSYA